MILHADALTALRTLPDASAQTCVTSPPYYALRDYATDGQIGLEDSPEKYVARLVEIFREARRVLRDDGTLWVVIGDSFAGSRGGRRDTERVCELPNGSTYKFSRPVSTYDIMRNSGDLQPKNLIGIPWMLAFALRADGWYLRQDIIWHKKNPLPESVRDRCTKAHEYIFLLSKSRHYYYDADAISEPCAKSTIKRIGRSPCRPDSRKRNADLPRYGGNKYTAAPAAFYRTKSGNTYNYKPRRNKRSVWPVSTQAYRHAHFATFPPELIRPCILAGSRQGDVVLDPFFGAGTVGVVAVEQGRNYIGIDINAEYCELARKRIANAAQQLNVFDTGEVQE